MTATPGPRDPRKTEEQELVGRARKRDAQALHRLVDRHAQELFATAVYLVGNRADAEDLVQETMLGMTQAISGYRGDSSFKTWLWSIMIRQAARLRRRRMRLTTWQIPQTVADGSTPSTDARMDIQNAIIQMSEQHREILVLREMQGMSYAEIAEVLQIPAGTVESRLFRARAALKRLLSGYGPQDAEHE